MYHTQYPERYYADAQPQEPYIGLQPPRNDWLVQPNASGGYGARRFSVSESDEGISNAELDESGEPIPIVGRGRERTFERVELHSDREDHASAESLDGTGGKKMFSVGSTGNVTACLRGCGCRRLSRRSGAVWFVWFWLTAMVCLAAGLLGSAFVRLNFRLVTGSFEYEVGKLQAYDFPTLTDGILTVSLAAVSGLLWFVLKQSAKHWLRMYLCHVDEAREDRKRRTRR